MAALPLAYPAGLFIPCHSRILRHVRCRCRLYLFSADQQSLDANCAMDAVRERNVAALPDILTCDPAHLTAVRSMLPLIGSRRCARLL